MSSHTSNALEPAMLNLVLRNEFLTPPAGVFLGLLTSLDDDGDTFSEISGAGYTRRAATFGAPSAGAAALAEPVRFPEATSGWGTITHVGVFDALSGGAMMFWMPLAESLAVEARDTVRIAAGGVTISLGGATSAWLANALLDRLLRAASWPPITGVHLALLAAFTSDAAYTEMSGGGYARQSCAFSAATDGDAGAANAANISFPAATTDWPTITHAALFDAATGGHLLWRGELDAARDVVAGKHLAFAAGDLRVTLD